MDFRILGPLEVVDEDGPLTLPRGRARALLALLILRAGEVVASERLIDELWGPTPPPTATTALHGLVSTLRKRLERSRSDGQARAVLETRPPGYVLAIGPEQVDANRFRRLLEQAAGAPPAAKAARLREALGLWRGPALADVTYEPFAQAAIAALEELRLTAVEERVDADLALGRHAEAVADLEGLTAQHPLRERLLAQLVLALYRCGRQADALDVYGKARRRLVEELGIDPSPDLQQLEQAILRQEPALELRAALATTTRETGAAHDGPGRWLPEERKIVTVVFVDLTESSDTAGSSDPEALQRVMRRYLDTTTQVLNRHGGTIQGLIGGVVVAVFGVPTTHEDDALRALRAAAELRGALAGLNEELEREQSTRVAARMGIDTGEVVVGAPSSVAASGNAITVASRLQQTAGDGEALLGERTRRLVAEAALLEPVDRSALDRDGRTIAAWRLVDLLPAPAVPSPGLATPMVGRGRELSRLHTAFARAIRDHHAHLLTVVGEAGIGKSRLALQFAAAVQSRALVVTGRCPAYGEGITFWPLREVVLQAAGEGGPDEIAVRLQDEDDGHAIATQVSAAIGLSEVPARTNELFPAVRRFFEALARSQPLVVVLEDVHWAQPTLLDLVEYLTATTEAAMLVVCLARPEFLEQRPAWVRNRDRTTSLSLEPLSREHSRELIDARLGSRVLPAEAVAVVVETAQGNPLFIEQLLAALQHERELSVPPSVQALLAARLDRLGPAERDLLRCAAVVGIDVPVEALRALVPDEARPFIERHLRTLVDKELIHPIGRSQGKATLAFRHVLVQLAAYGSITRQARSELHERVAEWYEQDTERTAPEHDAVIGYHLEQAHEQRRQLGVVEEHTRQLAVRAGERLAKAGLRAYARFDVAATENLLSRAHALLPAHHPLRSEVEQPLPEMYQVLGRHRDADRVLTEMLEAARAEGDELRERRIRLERARISLITGTHTTSMDVVRDEADQALKAFERSGDDAGIAQHSYVLGLVHLRRGELREMEVVARRGLIHAQRAHQPRDEAATRWWVALALVEGVTPVPHCIRECEELVRTRGGGLHPGVLSELARLSAMREEFERARELVARSRTLILERIRGRRPLMFLAQRHAAVEILAGRDLATAEDELRAALDLALDMGEPDEVAQVAAELSLLLSRRGLTDEAANLVALAQDRKPAENLAAQALTHAATARVAMGQGDGERSAQLGRQAVHLVPNEMLNLRARLHVGLAETLLASGQQHEATAILRSAVDLYHRKGNVVCARQARELASSPAQLGGASSASSH